MRIIRIALGYGILAGILACMAPLAQAAIQLSAPESVGRGNAFVARAVSDEPVDRFAFFWRGKIHQAKAEKGNLADGRPKFSCLSPWRKRCPALSLA